jgi:phosphoribosylformylglycinamidine synthase subunit PurL
LNPRTGAMHAVAEAARNVAASGARPIAATNCLNFGSPEKPEVMWQFSEVIDGITVACNELGTPITGGNVSFYNETLGRSIYPTPVIGMLGVLEDASRVLKIGFRQAGDAVVLLDGATRQNGHSQPAGLAGEEPAFSSLARGFSASEYSKTIAGIVAGEPPTIDLAAEKRLIDCLVALAPEGLLHSAHDVSDGGLAVALAESCCASARWAPPVALHLGALVNLTKDLQPAEHALFSECGARAIVSVAPTMLARVLETARQCNVEAHEIGEVVRDGAFRIQYKGRAIIDSSVDILCDIWANGLERILTTDERNSL